MADERGKTLPGKGREALSRSYKRCAETAKGSSRNASLSGPQKLIHIAKLLQYAVFKRLGTSLAPYGRNCGDGAKPLLL